MSPGSAGPEAGANSPANRRLQREQPRGVREEAGTSGGWSTKPVLSAIEQRNSEIGLESSEALVQRRRGEVQPPSGLGRVPTTAHLDECGNRVQIQGHDRIPPVNDAASRRRLLATAAEREAASVLAL